MAARSVSGGTSHCSLTSECSSAWEATKPSLIDVYGRCRVLQQRTRVCLTVSAEERIKVFPLVCSKYLSSWTGPDMTEVRVFVQFCMLRVQK